MSALRHPLLLMLVRSKLLNVAALAALLAATWFGWHWVWGVFFLYWSIWGIVTGQTFVVQMVRRAEHPNIFWLISLTWLVLSFITIFFDVIVPRWLPEWQW